MKYDAVIFDLFGTLVDNFDSQGYHAMLAEMSEAIGAGTEAFRRGWTDRLMLERRFKGELATPADTIRLVCTQLGLSPPAAAVQRAEDVRGRAKCTSRGRVKVCHLRQGVCCRVGSWISTVGITKELARGEPNQDGNCNFNTDTA